ncbi:DUF2280 domain-containing protein [Mesorhizobium sp. M4A.F.Ca.ET.090.04.2.1]|uniref:DUF2280 domain-containing protein n=1 Tax=Mesorhizobium sp. M4A.F.Ca.ET.090.04.2.1 TaxID=2496663 RepID=UPI000FCABED7|nr:DUF2280 domain-containing protein [Mesorhizobium sp. M4A.F.Ca.ET.090.04.2.1]RVC47595.1 DUF2280 domain-containing protein [Mesorhizobium sp. M4A.F.Ca.ET.090.04.2.1]
MVAKLSNEVKTFIVQALACFDTPSVVATAVKKEFGLDISRQLAESHDPTKRTGRDLAKRWKALFEETRKAFLEDTAAIGISHRSVRLRALQRMAAKAEDMGNMQLATQILRQAGEEMGGALTNRRELTGKDGKDLPAAPAPVNIFQLPDNGRG